MSVYLSVTSLAGLEAEMSVYLTDTRRTGLESGCCISALSTCSHHIATFRSTESVGSSSTATNSLMGAAAAAAAAETEHDIMGLGLRPELPVSPVACGRCERVNWSQTRRHRNTAAAAAAAANDGLRVSAPLPLTV